MQFAQLHEGNLVYAPNPLHIQDEDVFTNDPVVFLRCGFKQVVVPNAQKEQGKIAVADGWDETETEIIKRWKLVTVDAVDNEINEE